MSFNRLTYDTCAYSKTLQESTDPLGYNLYKGKYEYCISCPVGNFTNNLEFGVKIDVESDLKGQNREGTKCPSKKYMFNPQAGTPYTNPLACHNIYYITPNNLPKITTNGLKDINSYNNDMCKI